MPVRIRGLLALAALSLLVAVGASVGALYHREAEIGLRTGRGPQAQAQELYLEPGTTPTTEAPATSEAPTTTPAVAPRGTSTTAAHSPAGAPVGCVLGTYDEGADSCDWQPVTVSGRVTDTSGRPLAGICVRSFVLPPETLARTDAQGRYSMLLSQGGAPLSAEACGDTRPEFGWIRGGTTAPPVEPGGRGTAPDIVLVERGGAYGIVVDPEGHPIAGVCVAGGRASDAEGRFATAPLDPGRWDLGASGGGTASCPTAALSLERVAVMVHPGGWTGPVTVVASPAGD